MEYSPVFPEVFTGLAGQDHSSLFSTNCWSGENAGGYWPKSGPPQFHTLYYY